MPVVRMCMLVCIFEVAFGNGGDHHDSTSSLHWTGPVCGNCVLASYVYCCVDEPWDRRDADLANN